MAGAAYTSTPMRVMDRSGIYGSYPIKSAEIINEGDLVALDSNGQVVLAKAAATAIKAMGVAVFSDEHGSGNPVRTGVAALTVKCSIARRATLKGATDTLCPGVAKGGVVYLATAVPSATVSNYTTTQPSADGDLLQTLGVVDADGTTLFIDVDPALAIKYAASAATSKVQLAA